MLVVGGVTSLWGAVVGALAVSGLDSFLSQAENGVHVLGHRVDLPSGTRLVILASLMALVLILRPSGPHRRARARAAAAAEARVRVCIVGCGAVGSLFAANLANLDDVEVWAYDLSREHVDAINAGRPAALGRGRGRRAGARDHGRGRAAAVRLRDRRDEGDAHRARDRRDRAGVRRRSGCLGPERDRQRGDARRARPARDPRHDLPGRPDPRARPRAVGREGRHDDRALRAEPGRRGTRSSGSPRPAPAPACPRRRSPTPAGRSGAR